jgi:Arc/MetJ family transcription regulator
MKTTIDIPEKELADAMRFTRASTKREAVVAALTDFNRRQRMAELTSLRGSMPDMITTAALRKLRQRG